MADVEAKVGQTHVELDASDARVALLEAHAIELEKQLEQIASKVGFAKSKYSLHDDEVQKKKQLLATAVFCNGETEQRVLNATKDVSGRVGAFYQEAVKSQNTFRESFQGSSASIVYWLQILLTQETAAISKSIDDSGREALI